ncbi:MAG: GNAT family N-acetyltransferase [Longibaculum muris]|uniref:RimJ/RimL family protein N-acetyltransferase n=1 Tax=Longibaculum muris TaxID=1796628 RepID=A0A4R3Z6P5_9FIRM|nr:GNAT family N-acetyltransferase [Longibaculum muris]KXU45145.1 acetyltransferase, GNAT family [Candidatus Stoquefichus sp. KLE1796]MBS5368452.1 GNAT family N-acetyltransferase [Coprobacillus cateniformis]MCR1888078.1 GNAT family N-acetyltransferase [Longibaculum muris]MED9810605.1 GNAT family N-acetyltransferase [Longibaculum muris]TCW00941.1 RimJ/RimL family protein N-acetyltransferase [Longibaculum muris]
MDCTIRKWQIDDQYDLAKILNNQKIMNHLRDGLPYPYTVEDAKEYISSMLQANQEKMFAFAISVDEHVIGSISVTRLDNIHYCTGELGYYIGEYYWGKGYATSAVKQVCQYVFEHSDIIRIFAEPFAYNTASCRVLEKAGFIYEGTLHKNAIKNGQVQDMKMYALLRKELK